MRQNTFKKTLISLSICFSIWFSHPAYSDLASDLANYADSVGGAATSTPASIYQGQSRGYINGGRLFARFPQKSTTLFAYKAPKFSAGCGGIDAFGGSMSFISAAELVNTIKAIGSNAGSYAIMLGLRTISSQIANTLEENLGWLLDDISKSINSCQLAATAVDQGLDFLKDNKKQEDVCITEKMESGGLDYSSAKNECGSGGGGKTDTNSDAVKDLSFTNGNLIWIIMHESELFKNDLEMRKIVMSLLGTIVIHDVEESGGTETIVANKTTDSKTKTIPKEPVALTGSDILTALLSGGKFQGYDCADNVNDKYGCVKVTMKEWEVKIEDSLFTKTLGALTNIYNAIINRTDPATTDVQYIAKTSIPTMRILRTAALMHKNGMGLQIINDYADQIAIELLANYVSNIAYMVSAKTYKKGLGKNAKTLRNWIASVQQKINDIRKTKDSTLRNSLQIADQLNYYESIVISSLPNNLARSFAWTAGGGR